MASVHFYLALADGSFSPLLALSILGASYSLLLTFWSIIPLIIDPKNLSTAYGVATSLYNLSATLFPLIIGGLLVLDPSYTMAQMFYVVCALTGAGFSWWMHSLDVTCHDGVLLNPSMGRSSVRGGVSMH